MNRDALIVRLRGLEKDLRSISPRVSLYAKIKEEIAEVQKRLEATYI